MSQRQEELKSAETAESDAWLMQRIAEGNHGAFATLVKRHSGRFYRLAYRFTGNRVDAEDITQVAFVKLWEKPNMWQADKNSAFTTWFHRVITNLCLDHIKKHKTLQMDDSIPILDTRHTPEESLIDTEQQRLIGTHIASLPPRQRMALALCFYEGLSYQDAAQAMGLHLKALQSLLMRAKTTLKEKLNPYGKI